MMGKILIFFDNLLSGRGNRSGGKWEFRNYSSDTKVEKLGKANLTLDRSKEKNRGESSFAFIFLFLYSLSWMVVKFAFAVFRFHLISHHSTDWRLIFVFIRLFRPRRYHQSHQYQVIIELRTIINTVPFSSRPQRPGVKSIDFFCCGPFLP